MQTVMPWVQVAKEWGPLERCPDIQPDDWVRLIPVVGPELATVWEASPIPRDASGLPLAQDLFIDRKLVPLHDLMYPGTSPEMLCSERMVEALEALGATGWMATLVPHLTPHAVAGHRLYRLRVTGWTGPLIDTELKLRKKDPQTFHPRGAEGQLNGAPLPPVTFDASQWSGDSMCLSPWFDGPRFWWRALIVSGRLFLGLQQRLPGLTLRIEKVTMAGPLQQKPVSPGRCEGHEPPPARIPSLEAILDRLAQEAMRYRHELPSGATDAEISNDFSARGLGGGDELRRFLVRFNGAQLFGGALVIHGAGANVQLPSESYPIRTDWVVIGEKVGGQVLWAMDAEGRIRGLGHDGIVYGPDAPFGQWLSDQISDLAHAWARDGQMPWAEAALRG